MGIDVYKKNEKRNSLFTITDDLYEILDDQVIDQFEKITGVFIDNYGFCRLSSQHAKILLLILKGKLNNKDTEGFKSVKEFIVFLERVINDDIDLDLVGD